jgi:DNA (cytosine-5)-methyltransferase 1
VEIRVTLRILDLYCGAGGAGTGYRRAGFEVVGVDFESQPNYPFEFHRADALAVLESLLWNSQYLAHGYGVVNFGIDFEGRFDAIHASPPCKANTPLRHLRKDIERVDLVSRTRELLVKTGLPWIMENVPGAEMSAAVVLCGSSFGLGTTCRDGEFRQLRRHRLFEVGGFSAMAPPCSHRGQPVGVYGYGGGGQMSRGYKATGRECRLAMDMPWATKYEIAQAVPPAYTEYLGRHLISHISWKREERQRVP